ncbi:ABC transporter ATP-binding protein [Paucilactobacillus kaifaensis]|uniref:ABC transporter ATP-binding protein n=1 Tax=Paucilactobacillus kaifaensis TaxID=2559921 RepID=UPI0010F9CC70|nr:ABC transporter ATP-binding protein [Paucilactobacillus kaifaensis]
MENKIVVNGVNKSFKNHHVLAGVDLTVSSGSIYALLGANGSGKSTLLKIITGLHDMDTGEVTVNGLELTRNLRQIRQTFSLNSQTSTTDGVLTGFENLQLIAKLRHLPDPTKVADDLLNQFDLTDARDRRVAAYSGGMQRRLDIAMSLVGEPEILFLDEPTTGLDPKSRNDLWEVILDLKRRGKTIFLTTQYLEEADQLADQIGFLQNGHIVATGTPSEMKKLGGHSRLQLILPNTDAIESAVKLLSDFDISEQEDGSLMVNLDAGVSTSLKVLTLLSTHNIPLSSFQVLAPTLDDTFMQLIKGA